MQDIPRSFLGTGGLVQEMPRTFLGTGGLVQEITRSFYIDKLFLR